MDWRLRVRQNSFKMLPKLLGVACEIDNAQSLRSRGHAVSQFRPVERLTRFRQVVIHPAQLAKQITWFRCDLAQFVRVKPVGQRRRLTKSWLGGGTEHKAGDVVRSQFTKNVE